MTRPAASALALLLAAAALAGCVAPSGPGANSSATGTQINDPSFSGVTDTTATDNSYTPEGGL